MPVQSTVSRVLFVLASLVGGTACATLFGEDFDDAHPRGAGVDAGSESGDPDAEPTRNGSDAPVPVGPDGSCSEGRKACSDLCVSVADPTYGCGGDGCQACSAPANGVATCSGTTCAFKCKDGYVARGASCAVDPTFWGEVETVSVGWYYACGVKIDGTVACWGKDKLGRAVPPSGTFTSVSAGESHTCGVKTDGSIACWGNTANGRATPPSGSFKSVGAGYDFSCGLKTDGSIACWGNSADGRTTPPSGTFRSLSVGSLGSTACAIRDTGVIECWGYNLGSAPFGKFRSVNARDNTPCAVRDDGSVACWGNNTWGQASPPPATFRAVAPGGMVSFGIKTDGTIASWGTPGVGDTVPTGTFRSLSVGAQNSQCAVRTDSTVFCWQGSGTTPLGSPPGTFL
jgi:alpha-tubulin suppressor-like RCC1 family protein